MSRKKVNYIDKEAFSKSVEKYVLEAKKLIKQNKEPPVIPRDIAEGIMLICERLSHSKNFINYTYREDMVMDAVENCIRVIKSFNPNAKTKSGKMNAFSYFTTIAYYAMIRRIQKENKDVKIKEAILNKALPLDFMQDDDEIATHYVENIISYNIK